MLPKVCRYTSLLELGALLAGVSLVSINLVVKNNSCHLILLHTLGMQENIQYEGLSVDLRARLKAGLYTVSMLFCAGMAQAQPDQILHVYTENYPPYSMSLNGEPFAHRKEDIRGVCTDIVVGMLSRTDIPYRIKMRDWSMGLQRAEHKPNTALYCASKAEDRMPYFHWIGPLVDVKWTLFAKSGSKLKLTDLEQAKKYKIGGEKDHVMSNYLIEKGYNVSLMPSDSFNPRKLELGQIDLWVADALEGVYVASEDDIYDLNPVLTFRESSLYFAINKNTDPAIISKLNSAFKLMSESGEIRAILHNYFR